MNRYNRLPDYSMVLGEALLSEVQLSITMNKKGATEVTPCTVTILFALV
jgi:hypothetical protein